MSQRSAGSHSTGDYGTSSSSRKRVVVAPAWVRNLPPDELELMEDDANFDYTAEYDTAPSRPAKKKRPSLMTAVRGSTAKTESRTRLPEHAIASPSAGTSASSDTLSSPSTLLNNPDQPAASATRQDAAGPIPPRPVHAANDLRRSTLGPDRWWTFTLPSKYLDRVQDYVRNQENGTAASQNEKGKEREREGRDDPDGQPGDDREPDTSRGKDETLKRRRGEGSVDLEKQEYHRSMTMSIPRLAPPNVFSLNQTDTPGWSSPWSPFHRDNDARETQDPFTIAQANAEAQSKTTRFEVFILKNPFTPLLFRSINLALAVAALGISAHIRIQQSRAGVLGVLGSSTLFVICVTPAAILHIFVTLYIEYFGMPIGLWKISTKLTHTFTELIFICLFSAILSLSFDDLFTSALECTAYTPYARYNEPPPNVGNSSVEGTLADSMCGQQVAIVVLVFLSVILYALILIVSLFRIFAKVSRKS